MSSPTQTDVDFPTLRRTDGDGPLTMVSSRMESTDRYFIGEPIGRGGMGDIFAARDMLIGREVAIKRLRGEVPDIALDRFMREACIQGRLDHPAIVPVHELGVDKEGVPFFVMKRLAGETLTRIIAAPDKEKHSRQRLLRAFVDICLAVEFAHQRGFIHRDLKPDNIILGEYGEVYVIDWGVAKVIGAPEGDSGEQQLGDALATRDGIAVGTAGYMAPEQARGQRDLDERVDVYALGCMLFEILAGEALHPRGEAGMLSAVHGIDGRPSMRAPNRDVPPELDAICVKATAADREARPAKARALAEMVERYLDGDRDLELRRRLAREHVEAAGEAFSDAEVTESRRKAMRLAGRALALDPTSEPAAELVGRLMLEPPREVPREVQQAIDQDRLRALQAAAKFGLFGYGAYVLVLAMFTGIGFSSRIYPILFTLLIVVNGTLLVWYAKSNVLRSALPILFASAAMVALLARMLSPFFVAPGVAAVTAMAFTLGMMPTWRGAITTFAVTSSAIVLPYLAEVLGWISTSFTMDALELRILSPGFQADAPASGYVLVAYALVLVGVSVLMTHSSRRAEDGIRRSLHMQAWQLRQLVPFSAR